MCEVLPLDPSNQPCYSITNAESASSSADFSTSDSQCARQISFHCGDSDEFRDPYPITLKNASEEATELISSKIEAADTPLNGEGNGVRPTGEYRLNSLDIRLRKCSAPVLCSNVPMAPHLTGVGLSLEEVDSFKNPVGDELFNSFSNLRNHSSRFNLTPEIVLSPCNPSSSESNSSKPSSVSAFSRLARKLSQDNLYATSSRVARRCNTVADGLSLTPFQSSESASLVTRYSPRRLTHWYYSLTASYKTKLDQFRRIFRGTPVDTDRLLVDYSCALSKNNHGLLLQGRMYVTENWVCFYSKILYEQKIYLAVKEIIGITKEKTARVIPNAIQIVYSKNHERFFFTSFASRERTFAILRKVWENCRNHQSFLQANQTMSIEEIMQQVREIYGDDSLAMLEDEDTDIDPELIQNYTRRLRNESESSEFCPPLQSGSGEPQPASNEDWQSDRGFSDNAFSEPHIRSSTDDANNDEQQTKGVPIERPRSALENPISPSFSAPVKSSEPMNDSVSLNFEASPSDQNHHKKSVHTEPELGTVEQRASNQTVKAERKKRSKKRRTRSNAPEPKTMSVQNPAKRLLSPTADYDVPVECSPNHDHPGHLYANAEFPLSVDALFTCIFTDSEFFDRLSTSRGTFDMVQSSWPSMKWPTAEQETPGPEPTGNIERTICYTLTLKQRMGPRTCTAVEQQTLLVSESQPGRSYVVDAKVTNQAVPLCNCFCVVSRYCLLRTGRLTSRLHVRSRVVYEKPVFFGAKSIIENTCKSGLTDFFSALITQLTELASGLNDEDRLTGGYLAARSTNTAINHDGMAKRGSKTREKSKEDNKLVSARGRLNGIAAQRPSVAGDLRESGHVTAMSGSSSSSPAHGALGKLSSASAGNGSTFLSSSHSRQGADLLQFFLRPDRAWLLLALIGLLLCLFLSMVYSRLVALEQFAKHLSFTQPSFGDQSDQSGYQADSIFAPTDYQFSDSARNRIRAMKDLTQTMSQTLAQMQQVISKVEQSLGILEKFYHVNAFTAKAEAEVANPSNPPDCSQMSLTGVPCQTT